MHSLFVCSITCEKNIIEQMHSNWTTFSNLNLWFDNWEEILVDLVFGGRKKSNEEYEGLIVFFDDQKDRIINLDETDGLLDNKNGQRGGQPIFVFYSTEVYGGSSRANKTSYSTTIIVG